MGQFSQDLNLAFFRRDAPQQAGIFAGLNPATYNVNDPFVLWVIQTVIIICFTQLLSLLFARIRQPRVIAEVIGGVILGPTVMGRIPNFTNTIFPPNSIHLLSLTSTFGLVFFLFIVGVEVDVSLAKRNAKASIAISIAGLAIPLGLGAAVAVPVYHNFVDSSVNYGYFILFVAVAVGITAFPVLCRILIETRLLETTVGVLVLSAGIGNDITGWVLLALTVALVNASTGLTALYVLLTGIGFTFFLLFPVKWAFRWLARRTGSLEKGEPTAFMMTITLILVLISALFTDIIGIHPIFGGFLAGLIIPKDNGFAISVVEKMEDFVGLLLLPQYFTLSGLKTNLGLLDNGITWGYTILICVVAFLAKFIPCSVTAKAFGFTARESGAVGVLMACKGLVELIVLNVGLQAKILDQRVFSMFILQALVLTFITTPLTLLIYPPHVRKALTPSTGAASASDEFMRSKFTVVLDSIEQLPSAMTLTQLLQRPSRRSPLVELTERTSAVLKSQAADALIHHDPVLSVFRTFGRLNHFSMSASLSVIGYDKFPIHVTDYARENGSQVIVIPWPLASSHPTPSYNPFDSLFSKTSGRDDPADSLLRSHFVRRVFANSPSDVALFIDRGLSTDSHSPIYPHLCMHEGVRATIVRLYQSDSDGKESVNTVGDKSAFHYDDTVAFPNTVYSQQGTEVRIQSSAADDLLWDRLTLPNSSSSAEARTALTRISFQSESVARPLHRMLELAGRAASRTSKPLLAVVGRSRRMAVQSRQRELHQLVSECNGSLGSEVAKTFGDVASAFVVAGGGM
ncbi:cation/H+ exchanger [Multifurca ochricompacta]|uniref:Cation/H+ exchanger n=1 Tax=Multifurca ochricompacta TaxID=376703 RepID=A0AAD4MB14_9AGAM|nr:cation/H+ exchanger [Multifurca ochricompacta]